METVASRGPLALEDFHSLRPQRLGSEPWCINLSEWAVYDQNEEVFCTGCKGYHSLDSIWMYIKV